jgi:thymidylate kinase
VSERRWPVVVLLGPDYCGKSSVMHALAAEGAWNMVSCDDEFLPEAYRSIARLRHVFFESVLPHVKQMPTPEFLLHGLQMSTVFLRDWANQQSARGPTLVDSYYFKLLAKCACAKLLADDVLAGWRAYPPPDEVIYLATDPHVALARSRSRGGPNPFEAMSDPRDEQGFVDFQDRLGRRMRDEIRHLPTTVIDANRPLSAVIDDVRQRLTRKNDA